MKKNVKFDYLANMLNPTEKEFEQIFVCPDYAVTTLINGNISECIQYLRDLIGTGITGMKEASEQLIKIKEQCPERYEYINDKVYSYKY
jgi:hypothetical protein